MLLKLLIIKSNFILYIKYSIFIFIKYISEDAEIDDIDKHRIIRGING